VTQFVKATKECRFQSIKNKLMVIIAIHKKQSFWQGFVLQNKIVYIERYR